MDRIKEEVGEGWWRLNADKKNLIFNCSILF